MSFESVLQKDLYWHVSVLRSSLISILGGLLGKTLPHTWLPLELFDINHFLI